MNINELLELESRLDFICKTEQILIRPPGLGAKDKPLSKPPKRNPKPSNVVVPAPKPDNERVFNVAVVDLHEGKDLRDSLVRFPSDYKLVCRLDSFIYDADFQYYQEQYTEFRDSFFRNIGSWFQMNVNMNEKKIKVVRSGGKPGRLVSVDLVRRL
jgi:hypothetical protein